MKMCWIWGERELFLVQELVRWRGKRNVSRAGVGALA